MRPCILLGVLLLPLTGVNAQSTNTVQGATPATLVFETPLTMQASAPIHAPASEACKSTACVTEPKKNTKVVYSSRSKEYCLPKCSLLSWFRSDCGCDGQCEKRTKNVLVKKVVPDCDTSHCVLKEVPLGAAPCVPCGK